MLTGARVKCTLNISEVTAASFILFPRVIHAIESKMLELGCSYSVPLIFPTIYLLPGLLMLAM